MMPQGGSLRNILFHYLRRIPSPWACLHLAIIVAMFLISFYAFTPGTMSPDSWTQWHEAQHQDYWDAHPPIMAWWWGFMARHSGAGIQSLLFFHLALFWAGIHILGKELAFPRTVSLWVFLPVVLWFIPPVMGMTATLWKDTGMTCSWFLAGMLLIRCSNRQERLSPWMACLVWLLIFYGAAVRHNALTALPLVCVCFAWLLPVYPHKRRGRTILIAIALCASFIATERAFEKAIGTHRGHFEQYVMLNDIAYMSQSLHQPLYPDYLLKQSGLDFDAFNARYPAPLRFHYSPDNPLWTDNPDQIAAFNQAYIAMVLHYPNDYLAHRWQVFSHFLGWNRNHVIYSYVIAPGNKGRLLNGWTMHYLNAYVNSNWNKVYIWIGASVLLFIISLCRFLPLVVRQQIGWLNASALMYTLPYFFFVHSDDFRYIYWGMMATACSALILVRALLPAVSNAKTDAG